MGVKLRKLNARLRCHGCGGDHGRRLRALRRERPESRSVDVGLIVLHDDAVRTLEGGRGGLRRGKLRLQLVGLGGEPTGISFNPVSRERPGTSTNSRLKPERIIPVLLKSLSLGYHTVSTICCGKDIPP